MNIPFRPKQLLTKSSFLSYCSSHGMYMREEDLETLYRQGILVPAVRLYIGVNVYRKIYATFSDGKTEWRFVCPEDVKKFKPEKVDKKKYYSVSGIDMSGDWLEWYKDRHMVKYPCKEKYKKWLQRPNRTFTSNLKEVENAQEFFYDEYQVLWLMEVMHIRKMYNLPGSKDEAHVAKILKSKAEKFYNFMGFYLGAEDLFQHARKTYSQEHRQFFSGYVTANAQAKKDWENYYKGTIEPIFKKELQGKLDKYKLNLEDIGDWRYWLARKTLFGQSRFSSDFSRAYLKAIDEETLVKAEGANYMIFILNQMTELATGEKVTVRQVLGDLGGFRCVICHQLYNPRRRSQYTCGRADCKQEYNNQLRRKNRKTGRYKPR